MKKALLTIIFATTLTSVPVQAAQITNVATTTTGTYITFSDSTGFYLDNVEVTADNLYLLTGVITAVEYDSTEACDLVTMESMNGDFFQWFTDCGDWTSGDLVTCILDNNGTDSNFDDSVVGAF